MVVHTESAAFAAEGAQEVKFLLGPDQASQVRDWARTHLSPDPNGAGADGAYSIRSVYLDTPHLASYHRQPGEAMARFRIRRYGEEPVLHLERKLRRETHVRKQRTSVPVEELRWLNGCAPPSDWKGQWFADECRRQELRPICAVSYLRRAWLGVVDGEQVRLTLDRDIAANPQSSLHAAEDVEGEAIWDGFILEVKCRGGLPFALRDLTRAFPQSELRLSKYCRAVDRCVLGTLR
jgi:hypothetical protein